MSLREGRSGRIPIAVFLAIAILTIVPSVSLAWTFASTPDTEPDSLTQTQTQGPQWFTEVSGPGTYHWCSQFLPDEGDLQYSAVINLTAHADVDAGNPQYAAVGFIKFAQYGDTWTSGSNTLSSFQAPSASDQWMIRWSDYSYIQKRNLQGTNYPETPYFANNYLPGNAAPSSPDTSGYDAVSGAINKGYFHLIGSYETSPSPHVAWTYYIEANMWNANSQVATYSADVTSTVGVYPTKFNVDINSQYNSGEFKYGNTYDRFSSTGEFISEAIWTSSYYTTDADEIEALEGFVYEEQYGVEWLTDDPDEAQYYPTYSPSEIDTETANEGTSVITTSVVSGGGDLPEWVPEWAVQSMDWFNDQVSTVMASLEDTFRPLFFWLEPMGMMEQEEDYGGSGAG